MDPQSLLTIRNLTSISLNIKHYESLEPQAGPDTSHAFKNLTSFWSTPRTVAPPRASLEDVSVLLAPQQTCTAKIKPARVPQITTNIIIEAGKQLYQCSIVNSTRDDQILLPLAPNCPRDYYAVYHPEHHHLAILSYFSTASWMQSIPNDILLSALSIPGTHNSPTYHRALPSVRCQVNTVREQLVHGVRFLDIRVQPESPLDSSKETLNLVHGVFPISLTGPKRFRAIVNEVLSFLDKNPLEAIIMSVKREGPGNATDAQLSRILRDHYAGDVEKWFTAPRIPMLGEARGKIVLVRRFTLDEDLKGEWEGAGWCINADTWADNTPDSLCPSGDLCIQDFYEVLEAENIGKKIKYSTDHLKRAARCVCPAPGSDAKLPFYVNFLTASNFWKQSCWPDKIAAKLNPAIVEFLCMKHNIPEDDCPVGDGSTGIVVCDWVGDQGNWNIINCILGFNSNLVSKGFSERVIVDTMVSREKKENAVP